MSKDALPTIEAALKQGTKVDVLTWMPTSEREVIAYAEYLNEPGDKIAQLEGALKGWDEMAEKHDKVHVHTYSCTPVLHGTALENEWVEIEILPYETRPDLRPGVFFRKGEARSMYDCFWARLEWLLKASRDRKKGELPDWLERRKVQQ